MRVVILPDGGSYPYTGTGYANPDAVTSIGGTTFAYDNAVNQTTAGSNTFAWDWRNLLNMSTVGATSTTYNYDENGKRIRVNDGTTIFHYPNDLYQTDSVSGVPTKHVQLNGRDIAGITGVMISIDAVAVAAHLTQAQPVQATARGAFDDSQTRQA
jgi:YD repeat-containing protein